MTANSFNLAAELHAQHASHLLRLRCADSFLRRFRGLMLSRHLPSAGGLLILDCPSVHTAFMLYAIDVLYLAADGRVLKCVPYMKPWRASASAFGKDAQGRPYRRAAHTLELAAGSIARLGIERGDRLECAALMPASDTARARRGDFPDRDSHVA